MRSTSGQNRKMHMGVWYHHGSTLSLSEAALKVTQMGTMASLASLWYLGPPTNCYKCSGHRIAQVCVVFQLPTKSIPIVFSSLAKTPRHLAYVEWFSPIPATPDSNNLLYKVSRLTHNGRRQASIIPVETIFSSVHLYPRFGQQTPEWNTFSVMELCHSFYVNPFSDRDMYLVFSNY